MSTSGLITTTKELPVIRAGFPWTISMELTSAGGGAAFPVGTTYVAQYRARSSSPILHSGTAARVSDNVLTIELSPAEIDLLIAGLSFRREGLFDVADVLIEIIRTDPAPDEATGIIIQHLVVN